MTMLSGGFEDTPARSEAVELRALSWLLSPSATAMGVRGGSCCSSVVVMQATQDRDGHDGRRRERQSRRLSLGGDGLRYPWCDRTALKVGAVRSQDTEQLTLM